MPLSKYVPPPAPEGASAEERVAALEAQVAALYALVVRLLAGLLMVAFLDLVTLVLAIVIATNQGTTLDRLHDAVCDNSAALIHDKRKDIRQSQNSDLYQQLFPGFPPGQLQLLIDQQVQRDRQTIQTLTDNCEAV